MRMASLVLLLMGSVGCRTSRPSPETPINLARAQCRAYYERAISWIKAHDVPEWPEDVEKWGPFTPCQSDTVDKALEGICSELPPPKDPWGQQLHLYIVNQSNTVSWVAALHVVSAGPDCRFNNKLPSEPTDDIYYPPLEQRSTREGVARASTDQRPPDKAGPGCKGPFGHDAATTSEVVDALRQPSPDEAAQTLKRALVRLAKGEALLAATAPRHWATLSRIADVGPTGKSVVRTLLHRLRTAYPARKDYQQDMTALVDTAVQHPESSVRFDASMALWKRYGALAVPALVERLACEDNKVRINAHFAITDLGSTAVMPLLAELQSEKPTVRAMVAGELGVIGDARSLPALSAVADSDRDEAVRRWAALARDRLRTKFAWARRSTTADLYANLAEQYYEGRSATVPSGRPMLWRWEGRVIAEPVSPHLYMTVMAERMAAAAFRHDPDHGSAKDVQTRIGKAREVADALVEELE